MFARLGLGKHQIRDADSPKGIGNLLFPAPNSIREKKTFSFEPKAQRKGKEGDGVDGDDDDGRKNDDGDDDIQKKHDDEHDEAQYST